MMDNAPQLSNKLQATQADYPAAQFVPQPQDHSDVANENTWQQAYYVNDTFWTPGSDAPIFLCVGGEGPPIDGSAVVKSVHCNVAVEWLAEKKALMFALEHRYYGCHNMSACPVKDFEQKGALKYLSSRQAIEDVGSFVRQMNAQYSLKGNKWVTFGGSYPGMLAGWSRLHHPELIHAAVASSAPVHAKLNMFEYYDTVARAYTVSDNNVGGSPECRAAIREGHRALEVLLETDDGQRQAEAVLDLSPFSLSTKIGQQELLGSGAAYFPSQGNDPSCTSPACNIGRICALMTDGLPGTELLRLAAVRRAQNGMSLKAASANEPDYWFYQTCSEFGFYQTCEKGSQCMFVQNIDVSFMAGACEEQYGIKISDIEDNIEATNEHYGGLTPFGPDGKIGSCVLWPNGEVDPWASLSVLESPTAKQPVLSVDGASHHAWTHPSDASDQASVVDARKTIRGQVEECLTQDCTGTAEVVV